MRVCTHFGLRIASAGLCLVGGMLMLTAIGGTAAAGIIINDVPEIDPTSIASAVTLFFGSVLLLTGRRKLK